MSASRLLAPSLKRWGLSQSSPSSSFIRVSHTTDSCAVRMPPAGLKPTWGDDTTITHVGWWEKLDDLCKGSGFTGRMYHLPYALFLGSSHGWPAPLLRQRDKWRWRTPCRLKFWWNRILTKAKQPLVTILDTLDTRHTSGQSSLECSKNRNFHIFSTSTSKRRQQLSPPDRTLVARPAEARQEHMVPSTLRRGCAFVHQ